MNFANAISVFDAGQHCLLPGFWEQMSVRVERGPGSSGDDLCSFGLMPQASLLDGLSFDSPLPRGWFCSG